MSTFLTRCSGPGFRHPARPSPRWRAAPRYRRPSSKSRSRPPTQASPAPPALARELSRSTASLPDAAYLPVPRAAQLTEPSGSVVHALVYPPANPAFSGPDSELAPYIVWVHGGPTSQVVPRLDLEKAFFTSRGIGIIDVNYGGSSGYGRAYRERLRGQWGIVDVA